MKWNLLLFTTLKYKTAQYFVCTNYCKLLETFSFSIRYAHRM